MPEMSGIESTQAIRKYLPPCKQPTIIALTADAFLETKEMCLNCGMEAVLTKPLKEDELSKVLASYNH